MRSRNIKKQFWLNTEEANMLENRSKKVGLTESTFIRFCINNYPIREKPDEKFYNYLGLLRSISNNINQIAKRNNATGFLDVKILQDELKQLDEFILKMKGTYLYPITESNGNNGFMESNKQT